jgi:hypothetical protein
MTMTVMRFGRLWLCSLLLGGAVRATAETPSAAVAMMQAARKSGVPVGIVLREGNDLCREPGIAVETRSQEPLQRMRLLAESFGYRVDASGPVVLVTPNGGAPVLLEETLHHLWTRVPAQDSVLHTMGMVLDGWMKTAAGAQGWAMSSGSSPDDPVLHLPAGENETSQQIANRSVSLGSKGVWVAWQMPRSPNGTPGEVRMVTLSYLKYDALALDQFRCE